MKKRIWLIRVMLGLFFTLVSILYAYMREGNFLLNYSNTTFMIGLSLLLISGIGIVHISGFFHVFWLGWKKMFFREDPYTDSTHWSQEKDKVPKEIILRKKKAKYELFIYLPLFIAIILIIQAILFLFLLLK
ncbi:DUF3899 domain-containing protein [Tepidibacillus sp. LV47]|uniref:DUF3899 domain-containing protein n=1 Tax=Tepidibacillus sp. LV47 TaxID=3398228 RepID=UPI003AACC423